MLHTLHLRWARRAAALLALAAAAPWLPSTAQAHDDDAYWHDDGPAANNPQWMLTLSPSKKLTDLSLPGTHDSGTYLGRGGDIVQTQTMTIREQLNSGIRYVDIRLKHYDGTTGRNCNSSYSSPDCQLLVFHNFVPTGIAFEPHVLQPVISFLRDNPSELVIMRIAKETGPCDCNIGPALNAMLERSANFDGRGAGEKYSDYLLPSTCPDPASVTLGPVRPLNTRPDTASCQARGKVLIVQELFDGLAGAALQPHQFYRRQSAMNYVEPNYIGEFVSAPNYYFNLWEPVKSLLASAAADTDPSEMLLVGIVGYGGGFPYFFASGHSNPATGAPRLSTGYVQGVAGITSDTYPDFPRTNCVGSLCTISYEGMNTLVADYLARPEFRSQERRVGILNADFPGRRLIGAIASLNRGASFDRPSFNYEMTRADGRPYLPGAWTNGPVTLTPRCSFPPCTGSPASVSTDSPAGITYTAAGGNRSVQFTTVPVRVDTQLPTLVAAATTAPNAAGWYRNDVTVRFSCADTGGSGVASCPPDQVLGGNGTLSSTVQFAFDAAGNKSLGSNVVSVKIDKGRPSVTYRGNLGSYAPGERVDITCEAADRESGVASTTCVNIRGLASSFGAGPHQFSATATDLAGNVGSGFTSFTVVTLPGDLNVDGTIDCGDVAVVKASFGKRTGAAGFDARADVNGDGVVDIRDLAFVTQKLPAGTTCP